MMAAVVMLSTVASCRLLCRMSRFVLGACEAGGDGTGRRDEHNFDESMTSRRPPLTVHKDRRKVFSHFDLYGILNLEMNHPCVCLQSERVDYR